MEKGEILAMDELIAQVRHMFTIEDQWHMINTEVDDNHIRLKFFIGRTQTELQVFNLNDKVVSIGFNYQRKMRTMRAIIEKLESF